MGLFKFELAFSSTPSDGNGNTQHWNQRRISVIEELGAETFDPLDPLSTGLSDLVIPRRKSSLPITEFPSDLSARRRSSLPPDIDPLRKLSDSSSSSSDMSSTPHTSGGATPNQLHLNVLVLLPTSGHLQRNPAPTAHTTRPPPLLSRQSGSNVSTLQSLRMSPQAKAAERMSEQKLDADDVVVSTRRLSLAPGIGSGTQTKSSRTGGPSSSTASTSTSSHLDPLSSQSASSSSTPPRALPGSRNQIQSSYRPAESPPAFGSKRPPPASSGRRRPQTSAAPNVAPPLAGFARGSVAVPAGMGLGIAAIGGAGKSRPGWEGDEVVGVLRTSGLEVTVIRNSSHLPAVLSPKANSPVYHTFASQSIVARPTTPSSQPTLVILVPLCDSPTLPSLSLLLQQGTTPTAVCFQQDVLERARRTEEEWLPSALDQIRGVVNMRDRAISEDAEKAGSPVILAYSANPGLSSSTIAACVGAGAWGVLKPPYDLETTRLVQRMVKAAKEGRISSVVGLPTDTPSDQSSPVLEDEPRVILPPTALHMGDGEHEGEKILSAAVGGRARGMSGQWGDSRGPSPLGGRSRANSAGWSHPSRKASRHEITPLSFGSNKASPSTSAANPTSTSQAQEIDPLTSAHTMCLYNPSYRKRRRSVDIGGLANAMRRAQHLFEVATPRTHTPAHEVSAPVTPVAPRRVASSLTTKEAEVVEEERKKEEEQVEHTRLAELLSAMFYQTQLAIDVHMVDFAESATPLTSEDRIRLIDALSSWDFKPHHLVEADLFRVACIMFEAVCNIEGLAELAIDQDQMKRLLFAIRAIYHAPNPYHNYVHAIDVLQATYSFLLNLGVVPDWSYLRCWTPGQGPWTRPSEEERPSLDLGTRRARDVLRPQDVLTMLLAAMGHDVGHPGLSNAFMKNAKTPLSQVYDDKSVLENMHCMLIVQLLRKHGFSFLVGPLSVEDKRIPARSSFDARGFRKVLYSSVLATDMSLHFAWIARLKEFGARVENDGSLRPDQRTEEREDDRIMLSQALIKCADISNPTRPIDVSEHWSSVLLEEWAKQASLEQDLGLPVSVIASADAALQAKGQIGFIDLFTQPLFEAVADILPEMQYFADSCAENRALWQTRLDELSALSAAAADQQQEDDPDSSSSPIIPLVQPPIDDAALDPRYTTLFPLSLPTSLVASANLEPGPTPSGLSSSFPSGFTSTFPSASTSTGGIHPNPVPNNLRVPLTPPRTAVPLGSGPGGGGGQAKYALPGWTLAPGAPGGQPRPQTDSPTAKAMRAVYHANLLEQRFRHSGWSRGVPIPGVNVALEPRRMSTPNV